MTSKMKKITVHAPRLACLSLALGAALASLSGAAGASSTDGWVATRTQAFLPALDAANASNGARTAAVARADMRAGDPIRVVVSLNLRNEDQLDQFLQDLQTPGSASYGKFLTPAQFADRYAPTEAQAAAVVAHLQKSGFVNVELSPNRQLVSADGNAATVQAAFHTALKSFTHEGRAVYANADAAQVPAALGSIVGSVLGLQNVALAHTHHHIVAKAANGAKAETLAATATASTVSHDPIEFSTLYGAGTTPTASNTTVGIISEGNIAQTLTDLNTFASKHSLGTVSTQTIKTGSASASYTDTSGIGEWNLDSQSILGTSGGVKKLVFYVSPSMEYSAITASYNRAVTDNLAKVINVSLGGCEADTHSTGTQAADDKIFKQAVSQGQTFSVSTGDAGAYNCSVSRVSGAPGVPAKSTYDVSEPASSAYVIAVGGTTLLTSGGAYSSETVWNEGLSAVGYYDDNGDYDSTKRLWATGGGFSKYNAAPTYQRTVTGNSLRGLPDVAFDAASSTGADIIINGQTETIGGTSLAAPIFTGIWARLQSANGNVLGFPAASIYKYFPTNTAMLHDVTSGINGSGGYGYSAKAGWDAATGFGSVNIAKLNAFIKQTADFAR